MSYSAAFLLYARSKCRLTRAGMFAIIHTVKMLLRGAHENATFDGSFSFKSFGYGYANQFANTAGGLDKPRRCYVCERIPDGIFAPRLPGGLLLLATLFFH